MNKIKNTIINLSIIILRIVFIVILIKFLCELIFPTYNENIWAIKNNVTNIHDFIYFGLKKINVYNNGKILNQIDVSKVFIILSIYIIVEMKTLNTISEMSNGSKEIIKYYSKSKSDYFIKLFKIYSKLNIESILYWLFLFISLLFIFNIHSFYIIDILIILGFILVSFIYNYFISVISYNSLSSVLLYVSKLFMFSIFANYEYILLGIIFFIILIVFYTKRIGDNL